MFAVAATVLALLGVALSNYRGDFNIGFGAPLLVDLVAWYIVGAYLGVFPTFA